MDDTRSRIIATAVKRALLKGRGELDDATLVGVMIEAIAGAGNCPAPTLNVLFTVLTELVRRVIKQLPVPTRCDNKGRPIYSLAEVARALGIPDTEVDWMRGHLLNQGVRNADPAQTHALN